MVKDGGDKHGLQKDELEKFRPNFSKCANRDIASSGHISESSYFDLLTPWYMNARLRMYE